MTGRDGTLIALGREPFATRHGAFVLHRFHNGSTGEPALAITRGDVTDAAPLPARVHSSCVTSEAFGACDCDCAEQLDAALAHIAQRGRGVLFYLAQEGRGAGFVAKALDRMLVQASGNRLTTFEAYAELGLPADRRTYDEVAAMTRLLGITAPLRLLSNNPDKLAALRDAGALVDGTEALRAAPSPYNQHYLHAKAGMGHALGDTSALDPAHLPERVEVLEPTALAGAPWLVRVASYLLPIRGTPPAWFRLHLHLDTRARRECVVLTHGRGGDDALVRLERTSVLDRFPLDTGRGRRRWETTIARIVTHGRGVVLVADVDDDVRAVATPLLSTHLEGRTARPLWSSDDDAADAAIVARLGVPEPLEGR